MKNQIDFEQYQKNTDKLEALWKAAHLDVLTGLYNRYGLEEKIEQALGQMKKDDHPAVLAIDIDNFKYINDRFGHMLGDALLTDIAAMMKAEFADGFICGRTGGDEFIIFADNSVGMIILEEKARTLCERVCNKYSKEHADYGVTLSIGIAVADDHQKYEAIYRQADIALYQAKQAGKNRCAFFSGGELDRKLDEIPEHKNMAVRNTEQIGSSGFSASKILLCKVMDLLEKIEDPREAIEETARAIVESYHVTRAYACCYTEDEKFVKKSYFYEPGVTTNIQTNKEVNAREYARHFFNGDGIFFCTDVDKTEEPMRSQLKKMGVETFLQVILQKNGKYVGMVGINNCGYHRLWLKDEIETIHTIAYLLKEYIYKMQQDGTEKVEDAETTGDYRMNAYEISEVLDGAKTGLWSIKSKTGQPAQLFPGPVMQKLLGAKDRNLTPEQYYEIWNDNILPEYRQNVERCVQEILEKGHAEVTYLWNHPEYGEICIRCGGIRVTDTGDEFCIKGYHQNISDTYAIHLHSEDAKKQDKKW